MNDQPKWYRVVYIIGVVALILGALDPLEGSVVIAAGSVLLTLSAFLMADRQRKVFLFLTLSILTGIAALFYLSSLGGFGGESLLSWWWGLFIIPYPLGWLVFIILLIVRAVKKNKEKNIQSTLVKKDSLNH